MAQTRYSLHLYVFVYFCLHNIKNYLVTCTNICLFLFFFQNFNACQKCLHIQEYISNISYCIYSIGSKVADKFEEIVFSRQLEKDIPKLSPGAQTSALEGFHSVINHFAPKMYHFSYQGMQSRLVKYE